MVDIFRTKLEEMITAPALSFSPKVHKRVRLDFSLDDRTETIEVYLEETLITRTYLKTIKHNDSKESLENLKECELIKYYGYEKDD